MGSQELNIDHRTVFADQEQISLQKLIGCIKPLLNSAKALLMKEYLLVAKVIEPANFREAIAKVAKSLALIENYETNQTTKP